MLDSIRRSVAAWLAPAEQRADPVIDPFTAASWSAMGNQLTAAGVPVNERTALGIAAVWRAVHLYASTIGALNLEVRREDDQGGSVPLKSHPVYDLLRSRPNATQSAYAFRQAILGHALTFGNGYAAIEWNSRASYPKALHLLDPKNVKPKVNPDRTATYHLERENKDLPGSDVIHVRGLAYDGLVGYSPIATSRQQLGTNLAQQVYEGSVYKNGAKKGGHIEVPGSQPSETQAKKFRNDYEEMHRGAENAGRVPIFYGGTKWVDDNFSPADAQMILARGFSVLEVARIYGVPPHMLGVMEGATVGNAEQQALQFLQFGLFPVLRSLEGEFDLKLFSPQERNLGLFTRHDTRVLMRGDTAARMAYASAMRNLGLWSINEGRLDEGLNPLDDPAASWHWVPTNNQTPIETMGDNPPPTQPASNQNEPELQAKPTDDAAEPAADDA